MYIELYSVIVTVSCDGKRKFIVQWVQSSVSWYGITNSQALVRCMHGTKDKTYNENVMMDLARPKPTTSEPGQGNLEVYRAKVLNTSRPTL